MASFSFVKIYQRINNSTWLEWAFRVAFTLEFIQTALVIQENIYPDHCWLMILLAVWCYFLKARLIGFVPLIFSFLLHYWHVPFNQ